jgi:hypothetical protein
VAEEGVTSEREQLMQRQRQRQCPVLLLPRTPVCKRLCILPLVAP